MSVVQENVINTILSQVSDFIKKGMLMYTGYITYITYYLYTGY